MSNPLDWLDEAKNDGENEHHGRRLATPAELGAITSALDLLACGELSTQYVIKPRSMGRYRLSGRLTASVVQACVVSLEPVPSRIEEDFEAEFRPHDAMENSSPDGDRAVLDGPDIEPLHNNRIETGRIVFEHLSAALDPYPRKQGVEFDWKGDIEQAGESGRANPFAVLKKLKSSQDEPGA